MNSLAKIDLQAPFLVSPAENPGGRNKSVKQNLQIQMPSGRAYKWRKQAEGTMTGNAGHWTGWPRCFSGHKWAQGCRVSQTFWEKSKFQTSLSISPFVHAIQRPGGKYGSPASRGCDGEDPLRKACGQTGQADPGVAGVTRCTRPSERAERKWWPGHVSHRTNPSADKPPRARGVNIPKCLLPLCSNLSS